MMFTRLTCLRFCAHNQKPKNNRQLPHLENVRILLGTNILTFSTTPGTGDRVLTWVGTPSARSISANASAEASSANDSNSSQASVMIKSVAPSNGLAELPGCSAVLVALYSCPGCSSDLLGVTDMIPIHLNDNRTTASFRHSVEESVLVKGYLNFIEPVSAVLHYWFSAKNFRKRLENEIFVKLTTKCLPYGWPFLRKDQLAMISLMNSFDPSSSQAALLPHSSASH